MMRKILVLSALLFGFSAIQTVGQEPSPSPSFLSGEVTKIDDSAEQITIAAKDGSATLNVDKNTKFKRVSPQSPNIKDAIPASRTDIKTGDKIVAVVIFGSDKKVVKQTLLIVLMTKDDLAKKQEADKTRWLSNGVSGTVTAINATAGELTILQRAVGASPENTITIVSNRNTQFRRYENDSIKHSEAKTSSFDAVKIGDQVSAVGEKTADSKRLTAEEIFFGSFITVAGKIEAINPAGSEVTIKNLLTDKPMTVIVSKNTLLRRFPLEMAQRLAQPQASKQDDTSTQKGINSMFESLPALALSELKVGDSIAVLGSVGNPSDHITAAKFVAGVEPFLDSKRNSTIAKQQNGNKPPPSISIRIPGLDGSIIQ